MPVAYPAAPREFVAYIRQPSHWGRALLAAGGGYGAVLAAWELTHLGGLEAFIFANELPLDARRTLAAGLLAGMAVGLFAWFVLGLLLRRRSDGEKRWDDAAVYMALGLVLPLLPVLAVPGIAAREPLFVLGCLLAALAVVALVVRSLRGGRRPAAALAETPSPASEPVDARARRLDRIGLAATIALVALSTVFMTVLAVGRHNAYLTNAFDLGIHDQAIYNILHSGYMRTTLYGPYAIDYIGDHFSPILYLLAPIYALRQDARTLLALQSLFLAAAAIPLYLLARLKTRSVWIALALVVAWLLHPALHGVSLDDFHQIALVPLFLLAALYFLETDRDVPFLICLGLALLVKEEVALTVAAVGAYAFFVKQRHRLGAGLMVGGMIYFGLVTGWVMPRLGGKPQIDTRFGGYMAPGTQGASGIAWTLLTNPLFTAVHIFGNPDKVTFLLQVFAPVLFLPLLASPAAWLVAVPALAVQTLTDAHTQYDINGHYTAHLLPLVFFLAVLALGRLARARRSRGAAPRREWGSVALAGALVVVALGMSLTYSRAFIKESDVWDKPDAHDAVVDEFVAQMPPGAIISTLGGIAPHLTTRKTIYLFPDVADAEYLLLDTDLGANFWPYEGLKARDQSLASMAKEVRSGDFGFVRAEDGVYLFQRGRDVSGNEAILARMLSTRYEAEDLPSDFDGSIAQDPAASGGKVRAVTPEQERPDGKAALIYGPYTDLLAGNYRATFVLKATGVPADKRVMTLDVFTHKDGYPRAVREVLRPRPGYARRVQVVFGRLQYGRGNAGRCGVPGPV